MVFQYVILFNSDRELATTIHEASNIFGTGALELLDKYMGNLQSVEGDTYSFDVNTTNIITAIKDVLAMYDGEKDNMMDVVKILCENPMFAPVTPPEFRDFQNNDKLTAEQKANLQKRYETTKEEIFADVTSAVSSLEVLVEEDSQDMFLQMMQALAINVKNTCKITGESGYRDVALNTQGSFVNIPEDVDTEKDGFDPANYYVKLSIAANVKENGTAPTPTPAATPTPAPTIAPAPAPTATPAVAVKKAVIKTAKSKTAKTATVTWKKLSKVSGYQVKYSLKKSFKNSKIKTVKSYKTTSLKIKELKAGKRYYVKVRAYKVANGKRVYGKYSKVLKVKIKK